MTTAAQDYALWIEESAQAIEQGHFDALRDRVALADEVRDLGKSERREVRSILSVLLTHLLKMQYQPEKITRSWTETIRLQRMHLEIALKESPSLRPEMPAFVELAYKSARIEAASQTGLDIDTFPETCLLTVFEC